MADVRTVATAAIAVGILCGDPLAAPTAPAAAFVVPEPTGRSPIGTATWHLVDRSRTDGFGDAAAREIEVHVWYPAAPSTNGDTAPYLRDTLAEARNFAAGFGNPELFDELAGVRTHAVMDGEPAISSDRLPILVFSHGYTAPASAYTALLEDLASHGYAVFSIVHPYESAAATLRDGRIVSVLGESKALRPEVRAVFDEWRTEDATMAAVTNERDEGEQRRLLRRYLSTLRRTTIALRRWVRDTGFLLDTLQRSPRPAGVARLAARLDFERIGVLGHSMGGVTAGQFCLEDRRCRASLNLDGSPQSGTLIDRRLRRPLLMVYSARPGRLGANDAIYSRAAAPYYRADVRQTLHLDFSDMIFWPPLRTRHALGELDPARTTTITREIVRQFFDQELLGRASPLLGGAQTFDELAVRRRAGK